MNTKRVNNEFHRLDIKLPIDCYNKISEIAVNNFDARIHHISGKPEITPTLIYLLQLGIESFTSGNELVKKPNTDNYTDTIPITEGRVRELIGNELIPVQSKLDELSEIIYRLTYTDNNTDNLSIAVPERILDNLTDNDTDKLEVNTDNNTDNLSIAVPERILDNLTDNDTDKLEVNTDNKTDNDTDKIDISESLILPLNEDEGVIISETEEKVNLVDIPSLIAKHGFVEGAIEDKEKLALFCSEVLKRVVKVNDLSRVAKNEKGFTAPSNFWEYFSTEQINKRWVWTLITTA